MELIPIIDAHTHFWDPHRIQYDWLESTPTLNKPFVLEDFIEATSGIPIQKMVFVECNCRAEDNEEEVIWIEELAEKDPRIKAIVAYTDLTDVQRIDADLERLSAHQMVRGIRHNIQFNQPGFALQPSFVQGITKVLDLGRHFELCLTHDQMGECIELVGQLPDEPLMLDHCGKPGIKSGEIDIWKEYIKQIAEFPHVYCKISGLLTEADCDHWTTADILPYVDHVRECFGSERIVYGGDWPVSVLAGGYPAWFGFIQTWVDGWSQSEKLDFFSNNASRFYRI